MVRLLNLFVLQGLSLKSSDSFLKSVFCLVSIYTVK